jgi:hypothetical protein
MRLRCVVLHLGKNKLEAVVEDDLAKKRRRIAVTWRSCLPTDAPPTNWMAMVQQECDYARTQEQMKREGKVLPGFY